MTYRTNYRMGPDSTPPSLKVLILATIAISVLSAFVRSMAPLLALSLSGISHLYLWQLITYIFIHPAPMGISFPFLIHLAFNMYLLWTFGASLLERARAPLFLSLYFGSALFAGLAALGTMALFHLPYALAGSSTALYAILTAWVILNAEAELLLFFVLPFKARWILLALIGANLLIDLSNGDWINLSSYIASVLFGYFFALIVWRQQSPFSFLRPFERAVLRTLERIQNIGKKRLYRHSKIFDIKSGEPVIDDDQFMDSMLAKISLYGEDALTPDEKKRMQQISARKKK